MIKAVIFDFFGVLCSDEYWKIVKEDKNIPGHFSELSRSVNLGEISWESFVEKISIETGRDLKDIRELYESESINLPLVAYIEQLHQKYKTAILSNASESFLMPLLKKTGIEKLFDEVVVSSAVGVVKPDPKIFEYTLHKLGVRAGDAIFIDDIKRYLAGSESLGIISIWYQDFDQMKRELEPLLAAGSNN